MKDVSTDDWDNSTSELSPVYLDLHCMAMEVFARFRFGKGITSFSDFLDGIGVKYYIKALSDRYVVAGLSQGDFFFRFKF